MYLRELIDELAKHDPNKRIREGFDHPHSWRGDYAQVSFAPCGETTVGAMLEAAKSANGATYTGWKGGEFTMDDWSECYLAHPGDIGDQIGLRLLRYMLADEVAES